MGWGCGYVGVGVCVRVCVSASAFLCIRNSVRYTLWKRFVHTVKLLIIFNGSCSCCLLFVLNDWNVTKTNYSAHFYVIGEYIPSYPCVRLQRLHWTYCPRHAGMKGNNDRADRPSGERPSSRKL